MSRLLRWYALEACDTMIDFLEACVHSARNGGVRKYRTRRRPWDGKITHRKEKKEPSCHLHPEVPGVRRHPRRRRSASACTPWARSWRRTPSPAPSAGGSDSPACARNCLQTWRSSGSADAARSTGRRIACRGTGSVKSKAMNAHQRRKARRARWRGMTPEEREVALAGRRELLRCGRDGTGDRQDHGDARRDRRRAGEAEARGHPDPCATGKRKRKVEAVGGSMGIVDDLCQRQSIASLNRAVRIACTCAGPTLRKTVPCRCAVCRETTMHEQRSTTPTRARRAGCGC